MNVSPLILEDFGRFSGLRPVSIIDGERLESEKLAAFDKGYAAGWDDATEANDADSQKAERALAARMDELGFTFHEARAHVMSALRPLLTGIIESIVPHVLHETLGRRLEEAMLVLADDHPDPEVTIAVCPAGLDDIAQSLQDHTRFPIRIEADDSLEPGFIQMRMGAAAREIDMTIIEITLTNALTALDTLNEEALSNG